MWRCRCTHRYADRYRYTALGAVANAVRVHTYTYMCIHVSICVSACVSERVCVHERVCAWEYANVNLDTKVATIEVTVCAKMNQFIHTRIYVYIHMCSQMYVST